MEGSKLKEIGRFIRDSRVAAGLTQKSLAHALHITDKAVSKWERGICLPDVGLLPKIALLLDVDMNVLVSRGIEQLEWEGLIDIYDIDLTQMVYDKPLVYYILSHFLLLGITNIHILTNEKNKAFLQREEFRQFGFVFSYDEPDCQNLMIINHPWFLFGSDLTQQFQGAMISDMSVAMVPENQEPVFYFTNKGEKYLRSRKEFIRSAKQRNLGRGMICIGADNQEKVLDIANFVRTYQNSAGLLIGSLEEIAFKQGILSYEGLFRIAAGVTYRDLLLRAVNQKSVENSIPCDII